jgi:hypothetical protein
MSEPRFARMKRFSGYVDKHFVLHNPENPLIGGIGVQTIFAHIYPRKNKSYNKIAPLWENIENNTENKLC